MAGINKVMLIGNCGADPEVKYLENGAVVANLPLATTESYKDKNGNKVDQTEWHDLELWNGLAKIAEQYITKGKSIYVEGKIKSDTWQDDNGITRKKIRIRVLNLTLLGGPNTNGQASPANQQGAVAPQQQPRQAAPQQTTPQPQMAEVLEGDDVDDLPF